MTCGALLVAFGAVWMLSNLGLVTEDWWEVAVALLPVVWGAGVRLDSSWLPNGRPGEPR